MSSISGSSTDLLQYRNTILRPAAVFINEECQSNWPAYVCDFELLLTANYFERVISAADVS